MIHVEVINTVDKQWWNTLVRSVPEGSFFQTTYFADYNRQYLRETPYFVIAKDASGHVCGLLLLLQEGLGQQLFLNTPFLPMLAACLKRVLGRFYWIEGPLIFDKQNSVEILEAILCRVEILASTKHIYEVSRTMLPYFHDQGDVELEQTLQRRGYTAKPWATFWLNVAQEPDALWKRLKSAARKSIKKCQRQGLSVSRMTTTDDLADYQTILTQTRKRLRLSIPPYFPNDTLWKIARPDQHLQIFVARKDGEMVAGLGILEFNNKLREIAVAYSDTCIEQKWYAGDLIKWEIMKWAHQQGHSLYDLGGVAPEPQTQKEQGIYQFKAKWGGELTPYHIYRRVWGQYRQQAIHWTHWVSQKLETEPE